ncbi:hypothetical protein ACWEIJ_01785 [Lentzea sp. NPDC004789]
MLTAVTTAGLLALLIRATGRVAITWLALRGTKPAQRPAIIRALNKRVVHMNPGLSTASCPQPVDNPGDRFERMF